MIKKVIGYLLPAIIICFLIFTLVLNLFGVKHFVVLSNSMAPEIRTHELVYIKILDANEAQTVLKVGDIIAISGNPTDKLHRIVSLDAKEIIAKGDNNALEDEPVGYDQVIGVYQFGIPLIGILLSSIYPVLIILLLMLGYYTFKKILQAK